MSELVKVESITIMLVAKCPTCGFLNVVTRTSMPVASNSVNNEVELFYVESCHSCNKEFKVGTLATSE